MAYPFKNIEPKWQNYWDKNKTFRVTEDEKFSADKRRYVLDMFPYPSEQVFMQDIRKATLQQTSTAATFA